MRKITLLLVSLVACASLAQAQFYTNGNEGPSVRWNTLSSPNYRFVYPQGCDSLARAYATEWERVRGAVGFSTGFLPNSSYRSPMPVILHPYLGHSNGSVIWTPRRMEMYTGPDMYSPDPVPWMTLLAIHESRHVSQFQYVNCGWLGTLGIFSGELPAGLSLLYTEPSFLEGDAVAAETGLTRSGRGRTADFLEYYRASLDEGTPRSYARWRYGSQKYFTPDYYKAGYLMMGGLRTICGQPDIVKDHLASTRSLDLDFGFERTVRKATGISMSANFDKVLSELGQRWKEAADARSPFMPSETLTAPGDHFVEYSGLTAVGGRIYAVRGGMASPRRIVSMDRFGQDECFVADCAAASRLAVCADRILWTETLPSRRWEMESYSALRYVSISAKARALGAGNRTLVGGQRLYNPSVLADSLIAVCGSPNDGSQTVEIYTPDGVLLQKVTAPSGLQPYECAFVDGVLYVAALCSEGEGIWRFPGFEPVLAPSPLKINHLGEHNGQLLFVSDRTGVNELYALDGAEVLQLSNLRGGGTDFCFMDGYLYYTVLRPGGRMICRTPEDVLPCRRVDFSRRYAYSLADSLSALEKGAFRASADSVSMSEPKRYSRPAHALKIHSWLPLYVDADDIASMSVSSVSARAFVGASVMFQNDLNTFCGSAGYSIALGAAGNFTYSGLLPKFELRFSSGADFRHPEASVRSYIPLNFSSDGWRRAVIPHLTVGYANREHSLSGGIRAYAVQNTPASCIYPKWGIGAEVGAGQGLYELLYGYFPGFYETHGFASQLYYEHLSRSFSATLRYAMPILPLDWDGLSPLLYLKNFELIPFWSFNRSPGLPFLPLEYHSVGASLTAVLGNFWIIPYDIHIGIRYTRRINMWNTNACALVLSVDI